jgi:hypothetical protein
MKTAIKLIAAAIMITGLLSTQAIAQNAAATPDPFADLLAMVGNWQVRLEKRIAPQGTWESNDATATITSAVGATIVQEDLSGKLGGKQYVTKTLLAYDKNGNAFQRVFADSEHGVLVEFKGERQADTIVFDKNFVYPSGAIAKLRVVYKFISKNEFTVENMRRPETEANWIVTGKARYLRKK